MFSISHRMSWVQVPLGLYNIQRTKFCLSSDTGWSVCSDSTLHDNPALLLRKQQSALGGPMRLAMLIILINNCVSFVRASMCQDEMETWIMVETSFEIDFWKWRDFPNFFWPTSILNFHSEYGLRDPLKYAPDAGWEVWPVFPLSYPL